MQILMIPGLGLWTHMPPCGYVSGLFVCVHVCVSACMCVVKCQRVGSNSLDLITGTPLPKMTIMICQLH